MKLRLPGSSRLSFVLLVSASPLVAAACTASPADRDDFARVIDEVADASADAGGVQADRVEIVRGVPARGRDPGVVAIEIEDGGGLCSGTLVSPRLVLTARHCVSRTVDRVACPPDGVQITGPMAAGSLAVRIGDDFASSRVVAHGVAIVAPAGLTLCEADVAFLVLDEDVTLVKPVPIRARGPARGDHVRAVGFGRTGEAGAPGRKLVREHVRVREVTPAEFTVGESTCQGDSGGPALDEDTGEIVGVVSRGGPTCDGPDARNIYTRLDAWSWLTEEAFIRAAEARAAAAGGEVKPPKRGTKAKPASDVGGPCATGADCGAGVCITDGERRYCSRTCGTGDRCPARYHCKSIAAGAGTGPAEVCVNVR